MKWINQVIFLKIFYVLFLFFMLIRIQDGLLLSQLGDPQILSPRIDPLIWSLHAVGLPSSLVGGVFSYFIDAVIILLPIVILYFAFYKRRISRRLIAIHSAIFFIYLVVIYSFPTLSIRKYLGLLLVPVSFIFISQYRYTSYLKLIRYFCLFIFVSASFWKVTRGFIWDPYQMQHILKAQHIGNFTHAPEHIVSQIVAYLISHSLLCFALLWSAVISQLLFSVGFFTRKFDKILALLLLVFILMDYLIMRIEYLEFIVFLPLFFNHRSLSKGELELAADESKK